MHDVRDAGPCVRRPGGAHGAAATGNLLAAMLLHAVIDAASGMVAYLALRPVTAVGRLLA